jgi:hypothetical protein
MRPPAFDGAARSEFRLQQLAEEFPELSSRLDAALDRLKADRATCQMARRHPVCAEALAEVLEESFERSSQAQLAPCWLASAYSHRVELKLREALKLPVAEVERRWKAFGNVNVLVVAVACDRGVTGWECAARALEELEEYHILIRRLQAAGLFPSPPKC